MGTSWPCGVIHVACRPYVVAARPREPCATLGSLQDGRGPEVAGAGAAGGAAPVDGGAQGGQVGAVLVAEPLRPLPGMALVRHGSRGSAIRAGGWRSRGR